MIPRKTPDSSQSCLAKRQLFGQIEGNHLKICPNFGVHFTAIGKISRQLKSELPGLKGFSEENIKLMRRFYETWKDIEVKSVVRTTENTNFNTSGRSANSVVQTTELETQRSRSHVYTAACISLIAISLILTMTGTIGRKSRMLPNLYQELSDMKSKQL